jgi:hypothetical protein
MSRQYSEDLLQWIWKNREFDSSNLKTGCGKQLQIINPGEWNKGSGPDFLGAEIRSEGIHWHGSVEVHHQPEGWYQHSHHLDPNFNSTILHVVFERGHKPAYTQCGGRPLELVLAPHLHTSLNKLLRARRRHELHCSGNISFLNQRAFEMQVAKAHHEYFTWKSEELLESFNASLPPSIAWRDAFTAGVYRCLGVPANREPMAVLFKKMLELLQDSGAAGINEYQALAQEASFGGEARLPWVYGASRPASHPRKRVMQAAALHCAIASTDTGSFLKQGPALWPGLLSEIPDVHRPGKSMSSILESTVYLPAMYLLGSLFHSEALKEAAYHSWQQYKGAVPAEIREPFSEAGFSLGKETLRPGLAHHLKRYCGNRQCHRCKVFKSAIRS